MISERDELTPGGGHLTWPELKSRLGRDARTVAGFFPVWVWVGSLVAVSAIHLSAFGRRLPAPWIFPDELIYGELAKSVAAGGTPAVREVTWFSHSLLYPVVISPAWALADSAPAAYAGAKALNAVLVSLAAVPAYLLARRLLSRSWAFVAAVLAVALPSTAYAGVLMTENLFYPLFLVVALLAVLVVERPTRGRQLALVAALAAAVATRVQGLALVPAVVTAILAVTLLDVLAEEPGTRLLHARRRLAAFVPTWLALGAGALVAAGVAAARGHHPSGLLGGYESATSQYSLTGVPRWFLYHLAELDLYLGVLPLAAFLVLLPALRSRGAHERALRVFLVVTAALLVWTLLLVAAFASVPGTYTERVHERATFYVAPLLVTALLVWISRGVDRPRRWTVAAAMVVAALPAVLPYPDLDYNVTFEALALIVWFNDAIAPEHVVYWTTALAAGLAAVFLLLPRKLGVLAVVLVALNFYVVGVAARAQLVTAAEDARAAGVGAALPRDWVDRAVGRDADVAVVSGFEGVRERPDWPGRTYFWTRRAIWQTEFFNRSVGAVYYVGARMPYNLPDRPATPDARGLLRDSEGNPVPGQYALAMLPMRLAGDVVARDLATGLVLYRVRGALRLVEAPS